MALNGLGLTISVSAHTAAFCPIVKKRKRIEESKMSKQPPPAPTASSIGSCSTIIQIVGRPGTGSLPRTIAPPDQPRKWFEGRWKILGKLTKRIKPSLPENATHSKKYFILSKVNTDENSYNGLSACSEDNPLAKARGIISSYRRTNKGITIT